MDRRDLGLLQSGQLEEMKEEEEGKLGLPDRTREFIDFDGQSSLRRGSLIVTRRRGMARIGGPKTGSIGPFKRLGLAPLLCISQSPAFGCTSFSVSARRFVSWTALTPLRVGIECVWARALFLSKDSALPWRFFSQDRRPRSTQSPEWCDYLGPERGHS